MNPKVALVILIVLVVLACVALGLTFTADGMDDFGESSGKPEDSDWSETLTDKLMKEVVITPSLARSQTTEPDEDDVQEKSKLLKKVDSVQGSSCSCP